MAKGSQILKSVANAQLGSAAPSLRRFEVTGLGHGLAVGSEEPLLDRPDPLVRHPVFLNYGGRELRLSAGCFRKGISRVVQDHAPEGANPHQDFSRSEVGLNLFKGEGVLTPALMDSSPETAPEVGV